MVSYAPSIRTRTAAATRDSILQCATERFAEEGYDRASLREIASDAGVDAALISRYFGSKEELFKAVLCRGPGADGLFDGDPADFGKRMAHMLVVEPSDSHKIEKFLIMLRSASSPTAAEAIRQNGKDSFYGPFEAWIGTEDAPVRTRLAASIIMGFALSRALDETYGLDGPDRTQLCESLGRLIQSAIDGEPC